MNMNEFISLIKSRGAQMFAPLSPTEISIANTKLQESRLPMLPQFLFDLYKTTGAITLGPACIFGAQEIDRKLKYPLPSIIDINQDFIHNKNVFGKLFFGRNDLFFFATDSFGNCYMLDNLTLSVLRKYDDPYRAMLDCLIVGKI